MSKHPPPKKAKPRTIKLTRKPTRKPTKRKGK